jgi:hypothetical protein
MDYPCFILPRRTGATVVLKKMVTANTFNTVWVLFVIFIHGSSAPLAAQVYGIPKLECAALDTRKPTQFISFESVDRSAWDGKKRVKGVVLRLTNNSTSDILLVTPPRVALRLMKNKGKYVWQNDWDTPSLRNGSQIDLVYKISFPKKRKSETPVPSGDVILKSKLVSGESVLFSVPVKFLKQGGEVVLLFNSELNTQTGSVHFQPSEVPGVFLR